MKCVTHKKQTTFLSSTTLHCYTTITTLWQSIDCGKSSNMTGLLQTLLGEFIFPTDTHNHASWALYKPIGFIWRI